MVFMISVSPNLMIDRLSLRHGGFVVITYIFCSFMKMILKYWWPNVMTYGQPRRHGFFDQLIYKIYATPREINRYTNMFHQTTQIFRVENESIRDQTPKCLSVGSGSKVKESSTLGCFSVITIIAGCLQLHLCPNKLYRQMNFWEYFFPQVWWTRLTSSSSQTDFFAAKARRK